MLVSARLSGTRTGSRPTLPHCAETECECVGNLTNRGRLCGNRIQPACPRRWDCEELKHQNHRPTTRRYVGVAGPPAPERNSAERDQALQRAGKGKERRRFTGDWRKGGNDAHRPHVPDAYGLLDHDDLCAGAGLSVLVVGTEQRSDSNRSLPPARGRVSFRSGRPRFTSGRVVRRSGEGSEKPMTKVITGWTTSRARSLRKRLLALTVIALILAPVGAQAAGLGDLLSLIKTITSTLQKPVGGVLGEIQKINSEINKFRQEIIWPLNEINQARAFVSATRARYISPMAQIHAIKNNSASLTNPRQLESALRGGQAG